MLLFFISTGLSAAPYKVNFAVTLTESENPNLVNFPKAIQGKVTLFYDAKNFTVDKLSGSQTEIDGFGYEFVQVKPLQFDASPDPDKNAMISLMQEVNPNGVYSDFRCCDTHSLGLGLFYKGGNVHGYGIGLDNFFFSAFAGKYSFDAIVGDADFYRSYGSAVITGISPVPLPDALWLFGSALLVLVTKRKSPGLRNFG